MKLTKTALAATLISIAGVASAQQVQPTVRVYINDVEQVQNSIIYRADVTRAAREEQIARAKQDAVAAERARVAKVEADRAAAARLAAQTPRDKHRDQSYEDELRRINLENLKVEADHKRRLLEEDAVRNRIMTTRLPEYIDVDLAGAKAAVTRASSAK